MAGNPQPHRPQRPESLLSQPQRPSQQPPPPSIQPPPPVAAVPPGWLPAPDRPGSLRYWDGQFWTDGYAAQQVPTTRAAVSWWNPRTAMLAACAGIVIGSLMPWATGPLGLEINGMDGDGQYFTVMAVVLAVVSWFAAGTRAGGVIGIIGFGLITFFAGLDWENAQDIANDSPLVSIGLGLPVVIAAAVVGLVYSGITFSTARKGARAPSL